MACLLLLFRPSKSVCFSLDGLHVVSGSDDATVKLWDLSTEQAITTLRGHEVEGQSYSVGGGGGDGTGRVQ